MLKIGLDIGYGYTKAVASNGKQVEFPSLVGEGFERKYKELFGNDSSPDIDNIHIEIDGKHYFVGKLASLESKNPSHAFDQNKIEHISTKVLLAAATVLLTKDEKDTDIILVAGLPFSYYISQKHQFVKNLSDYNKEVTLHNGKGRITKQIKFNLTEAFPQSVGAIFQIGENYNFGNHGLIACIDIGTKTTDITVFTPEIMQIIENLSGTLETGSHVIHSYISREIKQITSLAETELELFDIEQIIRNGSKFIIRGQDVDLTKAVQEGKEDLSRKIQDDIALKWGKKKNNFSMVFLVGGGAELLKDSIQKIYPGSIVPDNPSMLNAKGFTMVATNLAQRYTM